MSTVKSTTATIETANLNAKQKRVLKQQSKKEAEKKSANLLEINLAQFANKLQSFEGKEKSKKDNLYIYPDGFTDIQKNNEVGRKFRNQLRRDLYRFANNILIFAKHNRIEDLQKEISAFEIFYKKNYRINDFSIASITNTQKDEKTELLKTMFLIVNEVISKRK